MNKIINSIREELLGNADQRTLLSTQHFFKESVKSYGVNAAMVSKISKEHFKLLRKLSKTEIFGLCEQFWQSGYLEESFIACNWSYNLRKLYVTEDFILFKKWVATYVNNWASCDTFCNHTMGSFIEMYPEFLSDLKEFTHSENRWMRRAAAVSLIVPARKGKFLKDILEISDNLLLDKDDLVQKGYGWMLKVASQSHQHEIFDYVIRNKSMMPRTALRYAIEKLPKDMKMMAMAK